MNDPAQPAHHIVQHQPGWWSRNWKWALCLGVPISAIGLIALIFFGIMGLFTSSEVYQHSLLKARESAEVRRALGEPIEASLWMTGQINIMNQSGEADITIPISGPKGSGQLFVNAEMRAGVWRYSTLEVEVEGEREHIKLLTR